VFEIYHLIRNITLIAISFGSIMFAVGNYFGNAKDLPDRVIALEKKASLSEAKNDEIIDSLHSIRVDIRELRSYIVGGRK